MEHRSKNKRLVDQLKGITKEAVRQREVRLVEIEEQKKAKAEEKIKADAIALYNERVTEEKLIAVARKGVNFYPILLLDIDFEYKKHKKAPAKDDIGALGYYVYLEIEKHGFTPEIRTLTEDDKYDTSFENRQTNFDEKIVVKLGQYVCIIW